VWLIRVFDGRDGSGKRRYINETFHGLKKAAGARLVEILNSQNLGTYTRPTKGTLSEYLDEWLDGSARIRVTPKTLEGYKWQLSQIPARLGDRRLLNIRDGDIQQFYSDLSAKGFSPKTVRHIHTSLRAALQKAVETRLLARNPCYTADLPPLEHREMQTLNTNDAARLLAAAKNDKLGIVFAFNLLTGCRPSETFALKWADIDFDTNIVHVQRTLQWNRGGGYYFDKPKTKTSRRYVPLPAGLVEQLREHRVRQAESLFKLGVRSELVFTSERGGPLHWQNVVKRHFKKVLEAAQLPADFRFYSLRHSCATLLLKDHLSAKIVSARLGHNSAAFTLDTYVDCQPDMQNEAAESFQRRFYG